MDEREERAALVLTHMILTSKWLAAHDRSVAEKCARIAASSTIPLPGRGSIDNGSRSQWYANGVNDSAARIRAAFAPPKGTQTESETEHG